MADRLILISGGVILGLGFTKAALLQRPLTPVVEGGMVVILLLALLDAFGDEWSKLASSMAVLAAVAVVYADFGDIAKVFATPPVLVNGGSLGNNNKVTAVPQ